MSELTVEQARLTASLVKGSVIRKLNQLELVSARNIKLYKDEVKQEVQPPAIFVRHMNTRVVNVLGKRKQFTFPMVISFHTELVNRIQTDLEDMSILIMDTLDSISFPTLSQNGGISYYPVYGKQISSQIVDEVLQVFVTYTIRAIPNTSIIAMEQLALNTDLQGGE